MSDAGVKERKGIFDNDLVTEAINAGIPNISTRPLLKPDQSVVEADFEVKSAEDIDVIDTVPDEESSTEYEYYYVYYDEEGNMVNHNLFGGFGFGAGNAVPATGSRWNQWWVGQGVGCDELKKRGLVVGNRLMLKFEMEVA